jgi:hypothetical protein
MSKSLERSKSLQNQIQTYFDDHGYTIVTDISLVTNKKYSLDYICSCGKTKKKNFHDILTRECRTCNEAKHLIIPTDYSVCPSDNLNELWVAVQGGFISNLGNAINFEGKRLKLDKSGKYFLAGKQQSSSLLILKAFGIDENSVTIELTSNDTRKPLLENVIYKEQTTGFRRFRYQELEIFKEAVKRNLEKHLSKYEYKILPELKNYLIFEDGNIYYKLEKNGENFLYFLEKPYTSSDSEEMELFYTFSLASEQNSRGITYRVDKLVAMAFNPIDGKHLYGDYGYPLNVRHKDGNHLNNHKNNLEWCFYP